MFQYGLRTLLIALAVGPPILAAAWAIRYSFIDMVLVLGFLTIAAILLGFTAMAVLWAFGYR